MEAGEFISTPPSRLHSPLPERLASPPVDLTQAAESVEGEIRGPSEEAPQVPAEKGAKKSHESAQRASKKEKKGKRSASHLVGGHERWTALRYIWANDTLRDLKTVREYVHTMFTPRDLSSIRERKYKAERLQEEGMRHLLKVYSSFFFLLYYDTYLWFSLFSQYYMHDAGSGVL